MSATEEIRGQLLALADETYREFLSSLVPGIDDVMGVRAPAMKQYARLLPKETAAEFMNDLPHRYLEENQLHMLLIARERELERCVQEIERFLPYIDNWSVSDSAYPPVFKRRAEELLPMIERWIASDHPYTVRYGLLCLMRFFLNERFEKRYCDWAAGVRSDHYYVNMMIAWYFATALAKQYDTAVGYLERGELDIWTHNKAIRKAIESYRVSEEHKAYLRTLRKKNPKK